MTQNEVSIIKNAVLDATEAYVDARLSVLDFVKTQIGVVINYVKGKYTKIVPQSGDNPKSKGWYEYNKSTYTYTLTTDTTVQNGKGYYALKNDNKYYHTVKCDNGKVVYSNVLSIGNIEFPKNSVVFLLAPNAQFSNQFILGKLDDTTFRVDSIAIGGTAERPAFKVDKDGNLTIGNGVFSVTKNGVVTATSGSFSGNVTFNGSITAGSSINGSTINGGSVNISGSNGTFKVTSGGATTIQDGYGTLNLRNGSLYMANRIGPGGPGIFAELTGTQAYSCWGAVNSAARDTYGAIYIECPTTDIIKAGSNASDKRLKKDIKDIDSDFAKELILNISPKQFRYKKTKYYFDNYELNFGVIAQDILEIENKFNIDKSNRLCYKRKMDNMYMVDYKQLIAPMIKVIQLQQSQINKLQSEIDILRKEDKTL